MKNCTHKTFIRKNCFTLFELLISVALLVVLSVVLLRTLVLTSDYWHKTDEQTQLQSDAKTFFSLLSDDIGNMIYAPTRTETEKGVFYAPLHLESSRLCLVTHNRLQSKFKSESGEITAYSDIEKVIYKFTASSGSVPGRIERLCSSDAVLADGTELGSFDMSKTTSDSFYPTELANKSTVIDTVAEFKIAAYKFTKSGDVYVPEKIDDNVFGSADVRMLHVKLVLLPVKRFKEYNSLTESSAKNDFVNKHGRIFYKTFWVKPSNQ